MIDEERIDRALRDEPEGIPSPFLARRIMNEIRSDPEGPLAFPWRRVVIAVIAGGICVALGIGPARADPFAAAAAIACAASTAVVARCEGA